MIGLVGCGKRKRKSKVAVRLLYTGQLFKMASAYCDRYYDGWYVLSAKHGLLHPDQLIDPYDLCLADLDDTAQVDWAKRVCRDLAKVCKDIQLTMHAGNDYSEPLREAGLVFDNPLQGLQIGKRLAWYKNAMQHQSSFFS